MPFISSPAVSKNKKKNHFRQFLPIYGIMLPAVCFIFLFNYVPMLGLFIAFKDVSPYQSLPEMMQADWIGLDNFARFFNSYYFWDIMGNTLTISIKKLLVSFPAPIILAILLNELVSTRFKKVVQTVSYLPHFISTVIMAGLLITILSTNGGLVNKAIEFFGGESIYFLGDEKYFQNVLVFSALWKSVGWNSIIYLAAITGIDMEQHEAATIDGANRLQRILYITLPGISNIVVIMLILAVGGLLNAGFEEILLLYSPSVYSVADVIDTYVYREGIINLKYSYTTAVGLFKSVVALILVSGTNWLSRRMGQDGIW